MSEYQSWEGFIRRKQRTAFERFLHHSDVRVRAMAEELQRVDAENRQRAQAECEAFELGVGVPLDTVDEDEIPF